jgi:hypothetical protein
LLDYAQILKNTRKTEKYSAKVVQFITQKFFELTDDTRSQFFDFYRVSYGDSAYQKLMADFSNWRTAKTIPKLYYEGVHSFVIRFLKNNDLWVVLENEFEILLEKLRRSLIRQPIQVKSLAQIYLNYFNGLNALHINQLTWLSKNYPQYGDVENAFEHFKYNQMLRLRQSFEQVYADIQFILNKLKAEFRFKVPENCTIKYLIDFLGVEIDLNMTFNYFSNQIKLPLFQINDLQMPHNQGIFKESIKQYLFNEMLKINQLKEEALINKSLIIKDLKTFFEQYQQYQNSYNEITLEATFRGEGGWLSIHFEMNQIINSLFKPNSQNRWVTILPPQISFGLIIFFITVTGISVLTQSVLVGFGLTFFLAVMFYFSFKN